MDATSTCVWNLPKFLGAQAGRVQPPNSSGFCLHPGRFTWNIIMEVWFRSFSFGMDDLEVPVVNLPGCTHQFRNICCSTTQKKNTKLLDHPLLVMNHASHLGRWNMKKGGPISPQILCLWTTMIQLSNYRVKFVPEPGIWHWHDLFFWHSEHTPCKKNSSHIIQYIHFCLSKQPTCDEYCEATKSPKSSEFLLFSDYPMSLYPPLNLAARIDPKTWKLSLQSEVHQQLELDHEVVNNPSKIHPLELSLHHHHPPSWKKSMHPKYP